MGKINGEGCSMLGSFDLRSEVKVDAHRDAEVFRVRLGKAIDFE